MFRVSITPFRGTRKPLPKEFDPANRLTSKKYAFVQTVPRPRWCPEPKKRERRILIEEEEKLDENKDNNFEDRKEEESQKEGEGQKEEESTSETKCEEEKGQSDEIPEEKSEEKERKHRHRHRHRHTNDKSSETQNTDEKKSSNELSSSEKDAKITGDELVKHTEMKDESQKSPEEGKPSSLSKEKRHHKHRRKKEEPIPSEQKEPQSREIEKKEEPTTQEQKIPPEEEKKEPVTAEQNTSKTPEGGKRHHRHRRKKPAETDPTNEPPNKQETSTTEPVPIINDAPTTETTNGPTEPKKKHKHRRHHENIQSNEDTKMDEPINDSPAQVDEAEPQETIGNQDDAPLLLKEVDVDTEIEIQIETPQAETSPIRDRRTKDENHYGDQVEIDTRHKCNTQQWSRRKLDRGPLFRERDFTPKRTNQSGINDVYQYWQGRKTPKRSSKKITPGEGLGRRHAKIKKISILDDPKYSEMRRQTIDTHDFSDISDRDLSMLLEHTREYTRYAASRGFYDEARKGKDLQDAIVIALYHKPEKFEKSTQSRLAFEERKRNLEEKWQKELEVFDDETQHKLVEMQDRQEDELDKFDSKWKEEETLRKYRKPSAKLLELWRKEKFMARMGYFDEAEIAGAEAKELQARELAMAQAFANRDYVVDRERMVEKHNQDLEAFSQVREHWRELIVSRQKNERAVLDNNDMAIDMREKETPRRVKTQRTPKGNAKANTKVIVVGPEISFDYQTVLPRLQSPAEICGPKKHRSRPESSA